MQNSFGISSETRWRVGSVSPTRISFHHQVSSYYILCHPLSPLCVIPRKAQMVKDNLQKEEPVTKETPTTFFARLDFSVIVSTPVPSAAVEKKK